MKHEFLKSITNILAPDYIKMAPKAMEAAKKIYNAVDFKSVGCASEHIEALIPELVWENEGDKNLLAKTPFGNYSIYQNRQGRWHWSYYQNSSSEEEIYNCDSSIEGIVLSNENWHTKVLKIFQK